MRIICIIIHNAIIAFSKYFPIRVQESWKHNGASDFANDNLFILTFAIPERICMLLLIFAIYLISMGFLPRMSHEQPFYSYSSDSDSDSDSDFD